MTKTKEKQTAVAEKIKILFLAANPAFTPPLHIDREIRAITGKIRAAEYRDSVELVSAWAVRPDDLLQKLLEHKPHIVHFSGHGEITGELVLLDKDGNPKPVKPEAIQALFKTLKDNIRIIFFNTCYSKIQAQALTKEIDFVIGMNTFILDTAATVFAASFYQGLGFGRTVQEAFDLGKSALMLEEFVKEEKIPELLVKKGVKSSCIFLIEPKVIREKTGGIEDKQGRKSSSGSQLEIQEIPFDSGDQENFINTDSLHEFFHEPQITWEKLRKKFEGNEKSLKKNETTNMISAEIEEIDGNAKIARLQEINVEPGDSKDPGKGTIINIKAKKIKGDLSLADILREKSED